MRASRVAFWGWWGPALALVLLAGCGSRDPWAGVTPQELASLQEARLLGIGILENPSDFTREDGTSVTAIDYFDEIARKRPRLAYGHVNGAVARMKGAGGGPAAVEAARRGTELLPDHPLPWLVLAQASSRVQDAESQRKALERALQVAPRNPRVLGALREYFNTQLGDHSARMAELEKTLVEVVPNNLTANLWWLVRSAERGDRTAVLAVLDRLPTLQARNSPQVLALISAARKAAEEGSPDLQRQIRLLSNLLSSTSAASRDHAALVGNSQDPADLCMREWVPPPPPLPEPELASITITWKDVTAAAGLGSVRVQGISPVAVGTLRVERGAGGPGPRGGLTPIQRRPDLFAGDSPAGVLEQKEGRFRPAGVAPAAVASTVVADLNNDYTLDLYSVTPSGDRCWLNPQSGRPLPTAKGLGFTSTGTFRPQPAGPGKGPGTAVVVDLDQDGDLDLLRVSSAPGEPAVRFLRNRGPAVFVDRTVPAGLHAPSRDARMAVPADFDGDGDPDVFVVQAGGPNLLFLNQRQELFRPAGPEWGLKPVGGSRSAAGADFDRDGDWDLAVAGTSPHGTLIYRNQGGRFEPDEGALSSLPEGFEAEWLCWLDHDNDTWLDLAVAGRGGVVLLRNERGTLRLAGPVHEAPSRWLDHLDWDQDGDLDLLVVQADGALRLFDNEGGNQRPWLKVELEGLNESFEGDLDPFKKVEGHQENNRYAIGAVLEPRTIWDRQPMLVDRPQMHVGLGRAGRAVLVRVTWTHGVPQNILAPVTGLSLRHDQKPTGSCPFLYTWDGKAWRFAGDFNWKSPLGMLFARGAPVPHDQTLDWLRIPGELVTPGEGGLLTMAATEELREISYFDMLRLLAVDHPGEVSVWVDERFKMGPPDPLRIHTVRNARLPLSAVDDRGRDVLPQLRTMDRTYAPIPAGPFRGVSVPHGLVFELGPDIDRSNLRLFLNGWIEPAGTSTNVKLGDDPDHSLRPPVLQAGSGGAWRIIDDNVGLPCGKHKTIVLDLSGKLRSGETRLRLTTSFSIRWDAVWFASGEGPAPFRQREVPLVLAELAERGFSHSYREQPDGPVIYDYNRPLPESGRPGWPEIEGAYTRLGDVIPLLRDVDDRYVIFAPGDELRLVFDANRLPPLPPGWKRDYVLLTDGWTKDSDPNTVTGESVGPLPFHGMKRYPYGPDERFPDTPEHRRWRREWNTRVKHRGRPE